jgi:hypothetical protein
MKSKLFVLLVVTAALALPVIALAADTPTPAATACQAEYLQIGADAFKAKYGATEAYAACLAAHGQATTAHPTTTTTTPPPASGPEAACKAEYLQIGADAFKAKYGATETLSACIRAHGGSTTTHTTTASSPTAPPPATGPEAACKAEYLQIGADAFKARYGATEAFGACLKAHGATGGDSTTTTTTTTDSPKTKPGGDSNGKHGATAVATITLALCVSEGQSLGKDAFQAKYGNGKAGLAACAKTARPHAQSILAACKAATTGDAFRQCVLAALKSARVR